MLTLYRILTWLAHPFLGLWLTWRQHKGKEDATRLSERFGLASHSRPAGKIIWIHAASMGEAGSALPLVKPMLDAHPDYSVLFTTGTVTSAKLVAEKLPQRAFHQYIPLDTPISVRRFTSYWKPEVALWVESELWPNLINATHQIGCTLISINSRMSERSFRRWRMFAYTIRRMLCSFSMLFPQSEEDCTRLRQLGAQNLCATGNLKYDTPPLEYDPLALEALQRQIAGRPVWLAASTHPGEEEQINKAHAQLAGTIPEILTILVPRHAQRGAEVRALCEAAGISISQRSKAEPILASTGLYIADTMGELGLFYRLVNIAFIGGSLVSHGGQNVLEPIRLGVVPVCGQHTHNFKQICDELYKQQALLRINDAEDLADILLKALRNPQTLDAARHAGMQYISAHQGISHSILLALDELIQQKGGAI